MYLFIVYKCIRTHFADDDEAILYSFSRKYKEKKSPCLMTSSCGLAPLSFATFCAPNDNTRSFAAKGGKGFKIVSHRKWPLSAM